MKKKYCYLYLFSFLLLLSCYDDDSQVIESPNAAHRSSSLTPLIKSLTLHNAAFDDKIDNSSCFSLVFPYRINVNSREKEITSIHDLTTIADSDDVQIIFPVSIVFFDYEQFEVRSRSEFNALKTSCEADFNLQHNPCLNFDYPISVREYNQSNGTFETRILDSNKQAFQYFDTLHESDVYEIDYPITVLDLDLRGKTITENSEFIEAYETSVGTCH